MDHQPRNQAQPSPLTGLTTKLASVPTRVWTLGFVIYAYLATTVSAAWFIRQNASSEDPVGLLQSLLWSGASYFIWLPTGLLVWFILRAFGPGPRGLFALSISTVLAAVTGAFWALGVHVLMADRPLVSGDWADSALAHGPVALILSTAVSLVGLAATHRDRSFRAHREISHLRSALAAARLASGSSPGPEPARLLVSVGQRRMTLDPHDVERFASAANYVVVHWADREGLIRETLSALEERLDPNVFARCHRSTIVNLAKASEIAPLADGAWRLTMISGAEVIVSRSYREQILKRLGR